MIEYILDNKEWLFSGIGVAILGVMGSYLLRSKRIPQSDVETKNRDVHPIPNYVRHDNSLKVNALTEAEKIARRFREILERMNENKNYNKYAISQLAQVMKLHKVSELEDVFTGKVEPTFKFIEDFCDTFGINKSWLTEGKEQPFSNKDKTEYYPLSYFNEIEKLNPNRIYFVRANTNAAEAFILLKITDWKYKILRKVWHISGQVGSGGEGQLFSFYKLIKKLRDEEGYYSKCGGLTLDRDQFYLLHSGEQFPGAYVDVGRVEDPWWDDLTDVFHEYPIADNYELWHGKSFIEAQEIIKSHLAIAHDHG